MGQRTQLLVELVTSEGELLCGVSIHYQWGFGRVMPMDALNICINSQYPLDIFNHRFNFEKLSNNDREVLGSYFLRSSSRNHSKKNFDYKEKYFNRNITPYLETMQNVFDYSDNNDGYMKLTLTLNNFNIVDKSSISFYNNNCENVSFDKYSKDSDSEQFLTSDFREAYKTMCASYHIELVNP